MLGFSRLLKVVKFLKTHRFENAGTNQPRKIQNGKSKGGQPLPQTLYGVAWSLVSASGLQGFEFSDLRRIQSDTMYLSFSFRKSTPRTKPSIKYYN